MFIYIKALSFIRNPLLLYNVQRDYIIYNFFSSAYSRFLNFETSVFSSNRKNTILTLFFWSASCSTCSQLCNFYISWYVFFLSAKCIAACGRSYMIKSDRTWIHSLEAHPLPSKSSGDFLYCLIVPRPMDRKLVAVSGYWSQSFILFLVWI